MITTPQTAVAGHQLILEGVPLAFPKETQSIPMEKEGVTGVTGVTGKKQAGWVLAWGGRAVTTTPPETPGVSRPSGHPNKSLHQVISKDLSSFGFCLVHVCWGRGPVGWACGFPLKPARRQRRQPPPRPSCHCSPSAQQPFPPHCLPVLLPSRMDGGSVEKPE